MAQRLRCREVSRGRFPFRPLPHLAACQRPSGDTCRGPSRVFRCLSPDIGEIVCRAPRWRRPSYLVFVAAVFVAQAIVSQRSWDPDSQSHRLCICDMVKDFSSDFSDDSEHSRAPVPLHVKNINIYYLTFMLYIKLRVRFCQGSRVDRRRRGAASTIGGETISMKVSDFCCFFFSGASIHSISFVLLDCSLKAPSLWVGGWKMVGSTGCGQWADKS